MDGARQSEPLLDWKFAPLQYPLAPLPAPLYSIPFPQPSLDSIPFPPVPLPWYLVPEYRETTLKRHHQRMLRSVRNHGFREREAIVQARPQVRGTKLEFRDLHQAPFLHLGRYFRGTLVVEPCYLTSIFTVLQDENGLLLQLRIAPFPNHALGLDMSLYQRGSQVEITNPFFVRFLDGTVGLRIADPGEIRTLFPPLPLPQPSPDPRHVQTPYPDDPPGADPEPVEKLHIAGILAWRSDQRMAASTDRKCDVCHDLYGEFPYSDEVKYVCSMECMARSPEVPLASITEALRDGRNFVNIAMHFVLHLMEDSSKSPADSRDVCWPCTFLVIHSFHQRISDILSGLQMDVIETNKMKYYHVMKQTDGSLETLVSVRESIKIAVAGAVIYFNAGTREDVEEYFALPAYSSQMLRIFCQPAISYEPLPFFQDFVFPWLEATDGSDKTLKKNYRKLRAQIHVKEGTLMVSSLATAFTYNLLYFNPERLDVSSMEAHTLLCKELEPLLQEYLLDPPAIFQASDEFPGMYKLRNNGPGAAFFEAFPDQKLLFIRNFRMPFVRTVLREWEKTANEVPKPTPDICANSAPFCAVGCWGYPSYMTHSCAPNCCYELHGSRFSSQAPLLVVRASKDIEPGEVLSIPCCDIFMPLEERRRVCNEMSWSSECACARCVFEAGIVRDYPTFQQLSRTYTHVLMKRMRQVNIVITPPVQFYTDDLVSASYMLETLLAGELDFLDKGKKSWLRSSLLYSYLAACHHWESDLFYREDQEPFPIQAVLEAMLVTDPGSDLALSVYAQCLWGEFFGNEFQVCGQNDLSTSFQDVLNNALNVCKRRRGPGKEAKFYREVLEYSYDELPPYVRATPG